MLTLNSSNISKIKAADFSYVNKMLESYYEKDTTPATKATVYKNIKELPSLIDKVVLLVRKTKRTKQKMQKERWKILIYCYCKAKTFFLKKKLNK